MSDTEETKIIVEKLGEVVDAHAFDNSNPLNQFPVATGTFEWCKCGRAINDWQLHQLDAVVAALPDHGFVRRDTHLPEVAKEISTHLREAFDVDDQAFRTQQVVCLAEEAGEFVGAARRYLGMARRVGSHEDVAAELADVVITSYVAAVAFDIDLDTAIVGKLVEVFSRGWNDRVAGGSA